MDEDTTNFYSCNLNIIPNGLTYAANYLLSILTIFSKYNSEQFKDLLRSVKKLLSKEQIMDKSPADIVKSFEQGESF